MSVPWHRIGVGAEEAQAAAQDFIDALADHCERICVAGSLRRRKPIVHDVEILFVPKLRAPTPAEAIRRDLFSPPALINEAEIAIANLLKAGALAKRPNVNGSESWGEKNKLGIHVPAGIPIDLFTATRDNFFNYLVCRTGGAANNIRICEAARARGWKWNPYGNGFSRGNEIRAVTSEREVFEFAGLPYLDPWER